MADSDDEEGTAFRRNMARGRSTAPVALVALVVVPLALVGLYGIYMVVVLCMSLWGAITHR